MKLPILFSILLSLAACVPLPSVRSLTLDRSSAALGETVRATLTGLPAAEAIVTVAGLAATATADGTGLSITVPDGAAAGPQTVVVSAAGASVEAALTILGRDTVPGLAALIVAPTVSEGVLAGRIADLGFDLAGPQRPLGGAAGACAGRLATIDVGGTPLGEALAALEQLEADEPGTLLHIDPVSDYDFDRVDHLGALGAPSAHARGAGGAGTLIAIFDTGVDEHPELAGRVRYDLGVNALDAGDAPLDGFGAVGHGTPAAVLAAGSRSGVAPEAEIVPAKVCDSDGICRSSELIVGICAVLAQTESAGHLDDLVLSFSLGGPTPIAALEAILADALAQGIPVAAAAGNGGLDGSPIHYPAAFDLPGLLAVAALETDTLMCVTFEGQSVGSSVTSGNTFTDNGVVIAVGDFDAGGTTTSGFVGIDDVAMAGGLGLDAEVNNVTLSFGFPYPLEGLMLLYGDYGGTINLGVDGQLIVAGSMLGLPVQSASGVTIEVEQDLKDSLGTLALSGDIDAFAVGGQELWIDEVCPRAAAGWAPADFSTRGPYVDLAAPGRDVRSGTPGGGYALFEGTSFATPQAAAAQALWRQRNPGASPSVIEAALIDDARPLPFAADAVGAGLIDLSISP
jgi:subtilisin